MAFFVCQYRCNFTNAFTFTLYLMNIILGITGSVAAYKTPWLVRDLAKAGHSVRVALTTSARMFVAPLALQAVSKFTVVSDLFDPAIQEGGSWHVHWCKWADAYLIAPCSATTIAKIVTGISDSAVTLLASCLPHNIPLIIAPAMDVDMWTNTVTQKNLQSLKALGIHVISPESGELASGIVGAGRLPELQSIVSTVNSHVYHADITPPVPSATPEGCSTSTRTGLPEAGNTVTQRPISVLVTAGPTHEPIDAVRSIVNHSTGTMGYALAQAAADKGFLVTLISGPTTLSTPRGVHRINVTTAAEMHSEVMKHSNADIIIMAAAVADFTPEKPAAHKIKKDSTEGNGLTIALKPTADILAELGSQHVEGRVLIGFALESTNVLEYAIAKLKKKNAHMIVANQAGPPHSGFGTGMNTITLVTKDEIQPYPPMSKQACAEVIVHAAVTQFLQGSPTS